MTDPMTNPRDDGEADDIAKQEAESVADAKRRLAKRSGTNPRDDGVAVAPCTCGQSGHGNAHDPDCPRSDYKPIKSERQEAMAARDEVEDVVRCLREACAYINITEQVRGYHSAASNGLVIDAADLIDRLSRQLAEARASLSCERQTNADAIRRLHSTEAELAAAQVKASLLDEIAEQLEAKGYIHCANAAAILGLVNGLESAEAKLAEAQAERDMHSEARVFAANRAYRAESDLAEARGVIERLEKAIRDFLNAGNDRSAILALERALSPPREQHPAAMGTTK